MTDVLAAARCPQCAALVRPGQAWCTLCHADLRPAPAGPPDVPTLPVATLSADSLTGPLPDDPPQPLLTGSPTTGTPGGRHALQPAATDGSRSLDDLATQTMSLVSEAERPGPSDHEIDAMLAELATQTADPLVGVVGRFDSRGAKVGLAVGLCLVAIAGMMLGAFMLAAIFG